ncbi:MAG: diguanylate cyclase, partial [Epsilonproteobacteria bacterium]|nr:diguanylate cyclase [Campylobacterota bacterium]
FEDYDVKGAMLIESLDGKERYVYNDVRAKMPLLPASTFKIPHTLIALDQNVVNAQSIIVWDKIERSVPAWNQDQTLESAFKTSCVWCYQKFARHIGLEKYDSYLKKLDVFGHIAKDDLEMMVRDVLRLLNKDDSLEIYKGLVPLIVASLSPSIASGMNDELANIGHELRASPEALGTPAFQQEIKQLISKRITLDKEEVKKKVAALDKILDEINKKIVDLIQSSNLSHQQVKIIRADLQKIDFSQDGFESVHSKLLHIASSLENETRSLSEKMMSNQETITKLQSRITKLESALLVAKQEVKEDYLTHVATRRALSNELERVEDAFARYKVDYTLCFIDIDHFKNVNDNYGHEAGDVILSTVGKILRKYIRQV